MKRFFLTPGPSQTHPHLDVYLRRALQDQVSSISHRSKAFKKIYEECVERLRTLLQIPDTFSISFLSSANEIWERQLQNLVDTSSFHIVNGAFSKKFADFSTQLGKTPIIQTLEDGEGYTVGDLSIPDNAELVALIANETSTGAQASFEGINEKYTQYPDAIWAVDAVSISPFGNIPFHFIDSYYFSVQKAWGLPAGLGVWIYNEKCVNKALKLHTQEKNKSTYRFLPEMKKLSESFQTSETPNVLGIYLLKEVVGDFLNIGIEKMQREMLYKSMLMGQIIDKYPQLSPFVREKKYRSSSVITTKVSTDFSKIFSEFLEQEGFIIDTGYGKHKGTQLRFANFPTHSKELYELLTDKMIVKLDELNDI